MPPPSTLAARVSPGGKRIFAAEEETLAFEKAGQEAGKRVGNPP